MPDSKTGLMTQNEILQKMKNLSGELAKKAGGAQKTLSESKFDSKAQQQQNMKQALMAIFKSIERKEKKVSITAGDLKQTREKKNKEESRMQKLQTDREYKKADIHYRKADQLGREENRKAARLTNKTEEALQPIQELIKLAHDTDPILNTFGEDLDPVSAVRNTRAGPTDFLKRHLQDSVRSNTSTMRNAEIYKLYEALQAYQSSVARSYVNQPSEACENVGKLTKSRELGNLQNVVINFYTKWQLNTPKEGYRTASRTEKFLEEMGKKLDIQYELEEIKSAREKGTLVAPKQRETNDNASLVARLEEGQARSTYPQGKNGKPKS